MSDSDAASPPPEPGPHTDPDRLRADIAALADLTAAGIEVEGEIQIATETWAVYGRTSYDGEVVVAEYHDEVEAVEVLRFTAPAHPPVPDDDRPEA
jgi:hypothetical protein